MEKLCQSYLGQVQDEIKTCITEEDDYSKPLLILIRHIRAYPDFYHAFFNHVGIKKLETIMGEMISKIFIPGIQSFGDFSEHQIEYHFTFVMNGIFAMLRCWLSYGCPESPEQIAGLIAQSMSAFSDYKNSVNFHPAK
ncbi:MAG: TetR family transcriptional regulator C-terminal domain-containing protein [Lachnospiraceae bacterium]|nr:TetR family transcriptional regulator C-terminal domain-containing protein [Lachnospiraceae bacterium]